MARLPAVFIRYECPWPIISVDDSESESDSKKQGVYGVIIRNKLIEENPLDGDAWKTVTDATKFDQPAVKARPPAQGAPALRLEQMDSPCPNFFHGGLGHVVRDLLEPHFDVECNACDLHKSLMLRCRSERVGPIPQVGNHRRLCSCYRASCWEINYGRSSQ
jgi:hypothetical protein